MLTLSNAITDHISFWAESNRRDKDIICSRGLLFMHWHAALRFLSMSISCRCRTENNVLLLIKIIYHIYSTIWCSSFLKARHATILKGPSLQTVVKRRRALLCWHQARWTCFRQLTSMRIEHCRVTSLRQIGAEISVDSDDADTENKDDNGSTLLCVFERGYKF